MNAEVDHLVVAAATLDEGVRWCEATLGVTPGPGGKHALMGTHNRLLSVSGAAFPAAYLEIIAIDPEAPVPKRVRWFGLDDPQQQARLREHGPQLIHVVVRAPQIDMLRWGLIALGHDVGAPIAASRETVHGTLRWQIVVRDDGALLADGALPTLIQWSDEFHPTAAMPASGVVLEALSLDGISAAARDVLRLRGVPSQPQAEGAITARLQTPRGTVTLRNHR